MSGRVPSSAIVQKELTSSLLQAVMERGASARFEVGGDSMLPLLKAGDSVLLSPLTGTIVPGDVVALSPAVDRPMVLHRVVAREAGGYVVRGDNCRRADGIFAGHDIVGAVTRVERRGRSVWFGSGRLGRLVAWAVRHGVIWRFNRAYYGVRRRAARGLKFLLPDSRLRQHKGDDGNE